MYVSVKLENLQHRANVRVLLRVKSPFNLSSKQPTVAANKNADATEYIRSMQVTLPRELDSYHICYGYHRYIREGAFTSYGSCMANFEKPMYKPYFLVFILTILNLSMRVLPREDFSARPPGVLIMHNYLTNAK